MTRRITGTVLILLGALGIALSAVGVIYVWRAAKDLAIAADESLIWVSETLKDVDHSLDVASSTLGGAAIAMDGLYTTTLDVSRTLSNTQLTMDEMAGLVEDDLPQSIDASLVALKALEETAAVIDQLLRGLQQFGLADYDPEISLDQAVAEASQGLAAVPTSLRAMGRGLARTSTGLDQVRGDILRMGDHMTGIQRNVRDADTALDNHRSTLETLQTRVRAARRNLDRPIQTVAWGITLLLIWIGLSQLAIVRWGIGLWQQDATRRDDAQEEGRTQTDRMT